MATLRTPRNTAQPLLDPSDKAELASWFHDAIIDIGNLRAAIVGVTAQLDADATVTDTDYNASDPAASTAVIADVDHGPVGRGLGSIQLLDTTYHTFTTDAVADIAAMRAAIVAVTAKLDADTGVTDANYASTWDPAATTATADSFAQYETRNAVAPLALADDIANIRTFTSEVAADLTAQRAAIVGITAKLDLDGGVTDTTYASGNDPAALITAALSAS
jgi:hypothetical protein